MVRDREVWHAAVYGVAKSKTQLGDRTTTYLYFFVCFVVLMWTIIKIFMEFVTTSLLFSMDPLNHKKKKKHIRIPEKTSTALLIMPKPLTV